MEETKAVPQQPSHARRILVVEDEPLLRDLIAKSVEASGFIVSTAANAADAKRAIKVSDPDALVLDIELGPGGGVLLNHARADLFSRSAKTPARTFPGRIRADGGAAKATKQQIETASLAGSQGTGDGTTRFHPGRAAVGRDAT